MYELSLQSIAAIGYVNGGFAASFVSTVCPQNVRMGVDGVDGIYTRLYYRSNKTWKIKVEV